MGINGAPLVQLGVSFFACSIRQSHLTKEMLGSNPEFSRMPSSSIEKNSQLRATHRTTPHHPHFQTLTSRIIPNALFLKDLA